MTELHLGYYIAILLYLFNVDCSVFVCVCVCVVLCLETLACVQMFEIDWSLHGLAF